VIARTLNPGDWFTVQFLYDGDSSFPPQITGRIDGQTRSPAIYPTRAQLRETWQPMVFGMFGFVFIAWGYGSFLNHKPGFGLGFACGGVLIVAAFALVAIRSRRQLYARLRAGTQVPDPD
jgi:hypothetical protein